VLTKVAHPKANIRRTFFAKLLCFDFMADILTIERGSRQQVAAELSKRSETRRRSRAVTLVRDSLPVTKINF
jgi:hypothetical protein